MGFCKLVIYDSLVKKRHRSLKKGWAIGRTRGGLNSKLHAVCDGFGRPVMMFLSEGVIIKEPKFFWINCHAPNTYWLIAAMMLTGSGTLCETKV